MTNTTEALKMAIEKLSGEVNLQVIGEAINACKEALESQELIDYNLKSFQEPVAEIEGGMLFWNKPTPDLKDGTKLYTHPAQPLSEHAKNLGYLGNHCDDMKDAFMCGVQFAEISHGIGVKNDN